VTVLKHDGQLYCLDSVCFHAGGPLALGDIEELPDGKACLKCPWCAVLWVAVAAASVSASHNAVASVCMF